MNRLLLTTAVAACMGISANVAAHQGNQDSNLSFSSDSCNLEFNNTLSITPDTVKINAASGEVIIDQDGNLQINGEAQSLSAADQTLLARYSSDVRGQVPQVAEIAMEGIALAGVALSEVGDAFGLKNMSAMEEMMSGIGDEIHAAFYDGGTFIMDQGRFDNIGDTFDSKFDQQMEQAIEQMLMESIGSILISLGSEMLSSGGDMSEFEQRMERMGEQIEQKVELQAKNIEQKADQMCFDFKDLAMQEDELQARIPALANYDVFKVEAPKSSI